jgi:hypothetical protein
LADVDAEVLVGEAGGPPAGEWKLFEGTYTTVDDSRVDNMAVELGFRGSSGRFRVDDVRVEAVG